MRSRAFRNHGIPFDNELVAFTTDDARGRRRTTFQRVQRALWNDRHFVCLFLFSLVMTFVFITWFSSGSKVVEADANVSETAVENPSFDSETMNIYQIKPGDLVEKIYPTSYPPPDDEYDFNGSKTFVLMESSDIFQEHPRGFTTPGCFFDRECKIPLPVHVLKRSKFGIGCEQIMPLLDKLRPCAMGKGKCEHLLAAGFWRDVYETTYQGEQVVLKVLKHKHVKPRNELRSVRETVLTHYLYDNPYVVHEMGHCNVPPTDEVFGYTTMSKKYPQTLHWFLHSAQYKSQTLNRLLQVSLDVVTGLHALHSLEFPYLHLDLQPRQMLLDDTGRVLINDFNRGVFLPRKVNENGKYEVCNICHARSKGRWRAPEEYRSAMLGRGTDVFSICNIIWSVFHHGRQPFEKFDKNDVAGKIQAGEREVIADYVPPEVKSLLQNCWTRRLIDRPTTLYLIQEIKKIIKTYEGDSRGKSIFSQNVF